MKQEDAVRGLPLNDRPLTQDRVLQVIYSLALAVSISIWFIAVRAPLGVDETGSYWQIAKGFSQILFRHGPLATPAYAYFLWLSTKIVGSSEIALRMSCILTMLGAVYLLYLIARELFDREIALIAAIFFCLHHIVVFEAVDVRPYALAVLANNASILILLRLRRSDSSWLAALFGFSAGSILWFHYLFAVILPALVLCFFVVKMGNRKAMWRQFGVALAAFVLAFLPLIPSLLYMFHTAGNYVVENAPSFRDLVVTFAPGVAGGILGIPLLLAAIILRSGRKINLRDWRILFCASLALVPLLILYGVSVGTPIHCFVQRHRVEAIPGIALCWAMLFRSFRSSAIRATICVAFVVCAAYVSYSNPFFKRHDYTWKYALEAAERSASADNSPVLICSPFPESVSESDYATVSPDTARDRNYFSILSYYQLSVPVVPMPLLLDGDAIRNGSRFLQEAAAKHERFLAAGNTTSYGILAWLAQNAAETHSVRMLGIFDGVAVLEFVPRSAPAEVPIPLKPGEPGRMAP